MTNEEIAAKAADLHTEIDNIIVHVRAGDVGVWNYKNTMNELLRMFHDVIDLIEESAKDEIAEK